MGLAGFGGLCAETVDEALHPGGLSAQLLVDGLLLRQTSRAQRLETAEVPGVGIDASALDVQHAADDGIEEVAIVRDQQQHAAIVLQPTLQPQHGVEIEVVGRFIEQQELRRAHQGACEVGAHSQPAGELGDRPIDRRSLEAEPIEQRCRATARRVTPEVIVLAEPAGLRETIAGVLRCGQLSLAAAQCGITVDHVFDHRLLRVRQFLRDHGDGQSRRALEVPLVRRDRALQQGEQRGFAAAVTADHTDLLALQQAERGVFDEGFGAASQADIAQVDHRRILGVLRACGTLFQQVVVHPVCFLP